MESKYAFTNNLKFAYKTNNEYKNKTTAKTFNLFVKRKLPNPIESVSNAKIPKCIEKTSNATPTTSGHTIVPATPPRFDTSCSSNAVNTAAAPISGSTSTNRSFRKKIINRDERANLPIHKCRQHFMQECKKSETLLLMGETGSGKTTQIPQFLLAAGYAKKGMIAVTQPRRVAAITIAKRVAQEQGCTLGERIGYTVRFEDCTSPQTQIRFLTDGSLLREALADRLLMKYTVIMLDEVHERTVNTDVLFGIVKEAQNQRRIRSLRPLKIVITSATMDIDHFSEYFDVKGMYLEGRMHPVRVMHVKESQKSDYVHAALVMLFDYHRNNPLDHDVLIFLTGQDEIEVMVHQIRSIAKLYNTEVPPVRVYPLYAQLPQNKQLECFLPSPPNARKVVVATNIAETSITIPGIRCVIDCGFVKQRVYNSSNGLDILRIVKISKAQAWQRCGRAGRDAPGICYRTYTQDEMKTFTDMPKPEILRSNISTVVLQLLALSIDCRNFDFLDRPSPEAVESAYKKLELLGAILSVRSNELTKLGKQMAQFPLDPRYSKLILSSISFGCTEEMVSLIAVLSGENVFITNTEKREQAVLAHAKFWSKHGDHLTLLNVFNAFQKIEKKKVWCHDNFLNTRNLMYATDVRNQLVEIVQRLGLPLTSGGTNYDQVRKCLIAGLYENIAKLHRDNYYLTLCGRQRAKIHPSSVFHGKYKPNYIIYTEIVLTERNYLRTITEIEPEWISEVISNQEFLRQIKYPIK